MNTTLPNNVAEYLLDCNSPSVQYLVKRDAVLAKVVNIVGPISCRNHNDHFPFLVHEIIEQMLSIKVGHIIYERLRILCNGNINPEAITKLTDEQIRSTGTSLSKVRYLRCLTASVMKGALNFSELPELSDDEVMKKLTKVHGIGTWTAKMFLLFSLNRQDILPFEDVAFQQGFAWAYNTKDVSAEAIKKKCKK